MAMSSQFQALLKAGRLLAESLPADAVLVMAEGPLDWASVRREMGTRPLLVAQANDEPERPLKERTRLEKLFSLSFLDIETGPTPIQERMSAALLDAVRAEKLRPGASVVVLYNGIESGDEENPGMDSLSVIRLGDHLELLSAKELKRLDTQVPLGTLQAVVDLATQIGREGREGQPIGTMFVVGDTQKVMKHSSPMNFNPFRGYSAAERDVRNPVVREQIKDLAKLEGALIIRRDGVAIAGCMRVEAPERSYNLSMGLGTRHAAASAISKATRAIAVTVSQSTGAVRLFQGGDVVLRIEPMARPLIFGHFRLQAESL
ncbi:MAG: diadenylate cyclase [Planctomycetota bacterium]|nr:diadenylate cyclase [Planctomycetota bacterium]